MIEFFDTQKAIHQHKIPTTIPPFPPQQKERYDSDDGKSLTAVFKWGNEDLIFDCIFSPGKTQYWFQNDKFGLTSFDRETLQFLWSTQELKSLLQQKIGNLARAWKQHFDK
jgi:hypothetical protein